MADGRTVLRETRADVLALPGLILVVLIAVVVRQFIGQPASPTVLLVCGAIALLDVLFGHYLLRSGRATFVVTPDDITFIPRPGTGRKKPPSPQVLRRAPASVLTFRLQRAGIIAGQLQYRLLLRDEATGDEISATVFGRRPVRRACESQGWTFS